jgi:hypothetical protein
VLAPVADGTKASPTVFEAKEGYQGRSTTQFTLKSVDRIYIDFL